MSAKHFQSKKCNHTFLIDCEANGVDAFKMVASVFYLLSIQSSTVLPSSLKIQSAECFDAAELKTSLHHNHFVFESAPLLKCLPLWGIEMTWTFVLYS